MPVYQFQHIPAGGHDSTAFTRAYQIILGLKPGKIGGPDTLADVAELADARDLKSRGREAVWVRVPPSVPATGDRWRKRTTLTRTVRTAPTWRPTIPVGTESRCTLTV